MTPHEHNVEKVSVPREAWDAFTDAVDDIGWADSSDVERFNYAVHRGFQALRNLLREGMTPSSSTPEKEDQ